MNTPGRNDPCHCGSGKKFKKCCLELRHLSLSEVKARMAQAHNAKDIVYVGPAGEIAGPAYVYDEIYTTGGIMALVPSVRDNFHEDLKQSLMTRVFADLTGACLCGAVMGVDPDDLKTPLKINHGGHCPAIHSTLVRLIREHPILEPEDWGPRIILQSDLTWKIMEDEEEDLPK